MTTTNPHTPDRLHSLDAVRGFALLIGVAFHAMASFIPGRPPGSWAMQDNSPSQFLGDAAFVTHLFRMSLFFFIAGYFGRLLYRRLGARGFWANRTRRILVPLVAGGIVMYPLMGFIWTAGLTKSFGGVIPPLLMPDGTNPPGKPTLIGLLMHLWFLYQLLLLYVAVIAARASIARFDTAQKLRGIIDTAVNGSLRTMIAVFTLGLILPLAAALTGLPWWSYWAHIPAPDFSLLSHVPASVAFGTAFAFGWLVHRAPGALDIIRQRWLAHLVLAVIATGYLLHTSHATQVAQPGITSGGTLLALVFTGGVALWGWVLCLTGAALRFLSGYSAVRRYIADASYWIYIAHIPVVVALQVWVGHWPLHWSVKYPFILVASFAVLFLSYHLLVRPTFIGQLLNGRKVPRSRIAGHRLSGFFRV